MSKIDFQHLIYGLALLLIGLGVVIAVVVTQTQAIDIPAQSSVTNVSPTITSYVVSTTAYGGAGTAAPLNIAVPAGGTLTLHMNGVANDLNGYLDIDSIYAIAYRYDSPAEEAPCLAGGTDSNYCYENVACDTQNGSGTTLEFNCPVTLDYWIDATDTGSLYESSHWFFKTFVYDGALTNSNAYFKEIATVSALGVGSSINWGNLSLGAATTNLTNVSHTITQLGNDVMDLEIWMVSSGLTCTTHGSIPRANIEWDFTDDGVGGAGAHVLQATAESITPATIPLRTDDVTPMTDDIYWDITIPSTEVSGVCSNNFSMNGLAA